MAAAALAGGLLAVSPRPALAQRCVVSEVTVTPGPQDTTRLQVGETFTYFPQVYDRSGMLCTDARLTWTSSNSRVATINDQGRATAVSAGTVTMTAAIGTGATRRAQRVVIIVRERDTDGPVGGPEPPRGAGWPAIARQPAGEGPAISLVVEQQEVTLVLGGEIFPLNFRAVREDGGNAAPVPVVFDVEGEGRRYVAVDSVGQLTSASEPGTATVRLMVPPQPNAQRIPTRTVAVTVRADSLRFRRSEITLPAGARDSVRILESTGRTVISDGFLQFTSSNDSVARVHPSRPVITAVAPGEATITATAARIPPAVMRVRVHRPITRLVIEPSDSLLIVPMQGTVALRIRATAEDGSVIETAPRWELPRDTNVAVFDTTTRVVRGRTTGDARLTVRVLSTAADTITRVITIRVVAPGLRVAANRVGLPVGGRLPLVAQMMDPQGQPMGPAPGVNWSSSSAEVARIDSNTAVAVGPGRARITGRWFDSTVTVDMFVVGEFAGTATVASQSDLWMYSADAQPALQVTNDQLTELYPAFSPDLTRIAFVATAAPAAPTPNWDLYIVNADGSDRRRLTRDSALVRFVSFAGDRVVYESNRGGRPQVWVVDASGGVPRQVTTAAIPSTDPSTSLDGLKVAFASARQTAPGSMTLGLFEVNLDGTGERLIVSGNGLSHPMYTRDGGALLFLRREGSGRTATRRVYRLVIGQPMDSARAVTPDSLVVDAFSQSGDGSRLVLNVSNLAGERRVLVYDVALRSTAPFMSPQGPVVGPAFRPEPRRRQQP